jgi:isocitrate dehydrogenase
MSTLYTFSHFKRIEFSRYILYNRLNFNNSMVSEVMKMEKIKMTTPLVEMDGDEMTRILWKMIKDELIYPFVDLKSEYYDLGLMERERTKDQVTIDSANATKRLGVAVKCATITPNKQRVEEYNLSEMWKSPNGTIRAILDGTVFRAPILIDPIKPQVKNWKKPITIARHAYGDVYKGTEFRITEPGKAELVFTGESGNIMRETIYDFECGGVLQGLYNKDSSIRSFAHSCFKYAISTKQDLWFSTKDTISKKYDQTFKLMFEEIYEKEYKAEFEKLGIKYFYTLIDDAVARVIRSEGGYIWACKNYDGDVMSDMVSTAFGSLAMMTSVLVSPDGKYEYEAAHGTVTRHYYKYLKGEETSTNPMATIFAWSGALRKRGELDGLKDLVVFADNLEAASIETLMQGTMTKDLVGLVEDGFTCHAVNSLEFIQAIRKNLELKY